MSKPNVETIVNGVAEALALHPLTVRAVLRGAHVGPTREPTADATRADRDLLLANARISSDILAGSGFERTGSVVAGIDSGSLWVHPVTGEVAEVAVRRWNIVHHRHIVTEAR